MSKVTETRQARLEAETRRALAEARNLELQNNRLAREEAIEMSLTDEAHVFPFYSDISVGTVGKALGILDMWSRKDPGCDITVIFCSPGGSVIDGLALFDFIGELRHRGHRVTTKCIGQAASMSAILMQAGDERIMSPRSFMHIHQLSQNIQKDTRIDYGELEDEQKMTKKIQDSLLDILAERSTLSRKQIQAKWNRREWLLTAQEALEQGFVDRVGW